VPVGTCKYSISEDLVGSYWESGIEEPPYVEFAVLSVTATSIEIFD